MVSDTYGTTSSFYSVLSYECEQQARHLKQLVKPFDFQEKNQKA